MNRTAFFGGSRVIIPYVLREKILKELHWEHPGICAMKAIARTCVWWHKMDGEIERAVKLCTVCQNVRSSPPSVPLLERLSMTFTANGKRETAGSCLS